MRACAAAGAAERRVKQRNPVAWLRLVDDPIKLPVFRDRIEILPEFRSVFEPAHQVVEGRDGDHVNSVLLLYFPYRRQIPLAPLHPFELTDHPPNDPAAPVSATARSD